ncbi:MAG TPA: PEP-CTERM sorting domain-containing protein [Casimicrobiaceae bacterium]|nr:PEP-CTERM sorting domain-containing protein [Casimicrobiaceae bacterium]
MRNARRIWIYLAALAAAGMTFCAPTEAKLVGSGFDPTLFDGTGFFFVPDPPSPCLTLPDGFNSVNQELDACQGVALVSVTVNVDDQEGDTATLTLGSPSDLIIGMVIDSESSPVVVGMDTDLIALNCTNITGTLCDDQWFIEWSSGFIDPVTLFVRSCDGEFCEIAQFGDPADHVTFFNPEPGSLALLGGGLIAGWVARRRKNRR